VGKRSPQFERRKQDKYRTPLPPVRLLLPHLPAGTVFAEPCAGNGVLIRHLESFGHTCRFACDIRPERPSIEKLDALHLDAAWLRAAKRMGIRMFLSNPPWSRPILHSLVEHLPTLLPTWLLFDADWIHTSQASRYIDGCAKIVSVGRVRWIPGTSMMGKDNSAWHFFPGAGYSDGPRFFGMPK
jgi:hypothetical protein